MESYRITFNEIGCRTFNKGQNEWSGKNCEVNLWFQNTTLALEGGQIYRFVKSIPAVDRFTNDKGQELMNYFFALSVCVCVFAD